MKIGVVFKQDTNSAVYRAIWPGLALQTRGHQVFLTEQDPRGGLDVGPLRGCDVVHVFRLCDPALTRTVEQLRRRGVAIVFDNDDDFRLSPEGTQNHHRFTGLQGRRSYQLQVDIMRRADVVTTTTAFLAKRLRKDFHGPIEIVENYPGPPQYVRDRTLRRSFTIGWVAGDEHRADLEPLRLVEALEGVMARHERVRVVTAGVELPLDPARYTHVPVVSFMELPQFIARFDLGIAPISDIPMNYARSNIKVKEYAAAGVPWAASDRGSYEELGADRGGVLVQDDGWERALDELVASPQQRETLRRAASQWGKTQRIDRHAEQWERVMRIAIKRAAERRAA